jgi:large subunit ribosomal protein L10
MENPRPEKVAVVDEVRERLAAATASLVTEYRGLTVAEMAALRRALGEQSDYKVYKNTLVRLAVSGSSHEPLAEFLTGPTAIAFVRGDVSAVAKTLRDFSRTNPHLVLKGGYVDGSALGPADLAQLADLPSREVLLARLAGALAAPLRQLGGLMQALPQNLAYGLSALLDQRGGEPVAAPTAAKNATPGAPADAEPEAGGTEAAAEPTPAEASAEAEAAGAPETASPPEATEGS